MTERFTLELLIIRHAESVANAKGILAGRIDPTPLSVKGEKEALRLKGVLADFSPERVFSSPMMRCRETARRSGATQIVFDERLIEMDYGKWSGKKLSTLAKYPEWANIQSDPERFTFPQGESFSSALVRIRNFIDDLQEAGARKIAIFTHGDISRLMINDSLNRELNQFQEIMIEPCSHSRISIRSPLRQGRRSAVIHYLNRRDTQERVGSRGFTLGGES